MARPTKLTPALLKKLEKVADAGKSIKAVCAHLEIDTDTFRKWEALAPTDANISRFHGLAARVRARANVGAIDAMTGYVEAAMTSNDVSPAKKAEIAIQMLRLLGTHRVEVTGKDGGPVEVDAKAALLDLLKRNQPDG